MPSLIINPSKLQGSLSIPPSKSHTLRALVFALMAEGVSLIENYLDSPDTEAMIRAIEAFGSKVEKKEGILIVHGTSGKLSAPDNVIDAGNSGQVLRFIGALAPLAPKYTVITGDASIRQNRPVLPLIDGLRELGAEVHSLREDDHAPLIIKGPLLPGAVTVDGEDSQPVSALLIACSFLDGPSELIVKNPGEKPWIDLTLFWLDFLGIRYEKISYERYILHGKAQYSGFHVKIPGDFSTAAFPIGAALVTDSEITLDNIDKDDVQGDKKLIDILVSIGAEVSWHDDKKLTIHKGSSLYGKTIDINDCIDALPVLAAICCYAKGNTTIINASVARKKESDRIHAIASELKKMGAIIEELPDGLMISTSALKGSEVDSHKDHRIAMALAIAALQAEGTTCIQDVECINKTYKEFTKDFQLLGCGIKFL